MNALRIKDKGWNGTRPYYPIVCQGCRGRGEVLRATSFVTSIPPDLKIVPCPVCGGMGHVDPRRKVTT